MTRPKFTTRKVLLRTWEQVRLLVNLIPNLPIDSENPLEIIIREPVKVRGLDQNGYYFMRLGEIAEQAWIEGRQYSKDAWHEYARKNIMPEQVTTKNGDVISKWIETPDGGCAVISTTLLEKGCFAEYTNAVEAFGASLGVMFSASRDEREAT